MPCGNEGEPGRGVLVEPAHVEAAPPRGAAGPGEVYVEAGDDFFHDPVIRLPPGTSFVWENTSRNPHTVTADDRSWDSGHMKPGDVFRRRFDRPCRYPYVPRLLDRGPQERTPRGAYPKITPPSRRRWMRPGRVT